MYVSHVHSWSAYSLNSLFFFWSNLSLFKKIDLLWSLSGQFWPGYVTWMSSWKRNWEIFHTLDELLIIRYIEVFKENFNFLKAICLCKNWIIENKIYNLFEEHSVEINPMNLLYCSNPKHDQHIFTSPCFLNFHLVVLIKKSFYTRQSRV